MITSAPKLPCQPFSGQGFYEKAILFYSILLLSNNEARAEWAEDFVKIECMPEFGMFTVQAVSVHSEFIPKSKELYQEYRKKYGLSESKESTICKIRNDEYVITPIYTLPSEKGACAADTPATVTIYKNGVELYKVEDFLKDCAAEYGPHFLTFTAHPVANILTVCPADGQYGKGCQYKNLR